MRGFYDEIEPNTVIKPFATYKPLSTQFVSCILALIFSPDLHLPGNLVTLGKECHKILEKDRKKGRKATYHFISNTIIYNYLTIIVSDQPIEMFV